MKNAITILLLATACSEPPGPVMVLDARGPDAGDAGDAGGQCQRARCQDDDAGPPELDAGLPLGAPCELLADRCGPGTGCRVLGQGFACQAAGELGQGADCTAVGSAGCAPGLDCFAGATGRLTCRRWCDVDQAGACAPPLACYPRSLPAPYPANAGACG